MRVEKPEYQEGKVCLEVFHEAPSHRSCLKSRYTTLRIESNCVTQVVLPTRLQEKAIKLAHTWTHPGQEGLILFSRHG